MRRRLFSACLMVGVTCVGTTLTTAGCGGWPTVNEAAIPCELAVSIEPAELAAKAWWLLDNDSTHKPPDAIATVSQGSHTVSFAAIDGYNTPAAETVTVSTSATTTVTGTYTPGSPGTGALKVTVQPAAAAASAKWAYAGNTTVYAAGQTVTGLWAGTYLVAFDSVAGYTPPAVQTITVTAGATTAVIGTYTPLAPSLTVTIEPPAAAASAVWTVDGGSTTHTSGQTVSGLSVGSHTVGFSSVAGYSTPAAQTLTLSAGGAATVTGTYTPLSASLTVTIEPAAAAASAVWTLDGDSTTHTSGQTVSGLSAGNHTVSFSSIAGYVKPDNQQVSLTGGQTASATGTYVVYGSVNTTVQRRRGR